MAETENPFGGGPFGGGPFGPKPQTGAVNFDQAVTANVSAAATLTLDVGKIVLVGVDVATVFGAKSITFAVTSAIDVAASVTKAVTFAVAAALFDATASVIKNVGKLVTAASATAQGAQGAKDVGKNAVASVTVAASVMRAVAFAVTALVDLAVTIVKAISFTVGAVLDAVSATVTIIASIPLTVTAQISATGRAIKEVSVSLVAAQISAAVSSILATLFIVSTNILQKPIDCVLAGHQRIFDRLREYDIKPTNFRSTVRGTRSGARRLGGDKPSFRVRTDKKGYD
jgi:hypothetical protein